MTQRTKPTSLDYLRAIRARIPFSEMIPEWRNDIALQIMFRRYPPHALASLILRDMTVGPGAYQTSYRDRTIILTFPRCMHCNHAYTEHMPAGGKCLFDTTRYSDRGAPVPEPTSWG